MARERRASALETNENATSTSWQSNESRFMAALHWPSILRWLASHFGRNQDICGRPEANSDYCFISCRRSYVIKSLDFKKRCYCSRGVCDGCWVKLTVMILPLSWEFYLGLVLWTRPAFPFMVEMLSALLSSSRDARRLTTSNLHFTTTSTTATWPESIPFLTFFGWWGSSATTNIWKVTSATHDVRISTWPKLLLRPTQPTILL